MSWDGIPFTERRKRDRPSFTAKNKIRGDNGVTTLVATGSPLVPEIAPAAAEAGADGVSISDHTGGADGVAITSLTTPYANPDLLSAFEGLWSAPPIPIPFKNLKLKRLHLPFAKRPDKRAEAAYLAAWYQIEQQGLGSGSHPQRDCSVQAPAACSEGNAIELEALLAKRPVADDLSIPDFLKREPVAVSESPDGILEAAE